MICMVYGIHDFSPKKSGICKYRGVGNGEKKKAGIPCCHTLKKSGIAAPSIGGGRFFTWNSPLHFGNIFGSVVHEIVTPLHWATRLKSHTPLVEDLRILHSPTVGV